MCIWDGICEAVETNDPVAMAAIFKHLCCQSGRIGKKSLFSRLHACFFSSDAAILAVPEAPHCAAAEARKSTLALRNLTLSIAAASSPAPPSTEVLNKIEDIRATFVFRGPIKIALEVEMRVPSADNERVGV
ncbi:hypothetical protein B0H15DRAFT_951193 [Mycena belliarum]|uniref:Uncharacterized protein n=1 Tax=Mycena belliarum TaxID=1033014 RepID=A0AAD6XQA6_9AGAR|nr:hypothetical protein B0H15DRAFT_951193 [Mycena belliae]